MKHGEERDQGVSKRVGVYALCVCVCDCVCVCHCVCTCANVYVYTNLNNVHVLAPVLARVSTCTSCLRMMCVKVEMVLGRNHTLKNACHHTH